jgi:ATP-dependent Clp protease ATP-binding subunit ClpX
LEILSPCESAQQTSTDQEVPLSPAKIKAVLDEHVVGQESAKRSLAVAAYNHCKIIRHNYRANQELQLEKTNSIVVGPTGCGKTLLIKVIGKILSVPTVIVDATTLTEAGYVGEDVESILHKLLKAADNDIQVAQKGIIYIDEIDKIAIKSETSRSITRDVSGEGVQQALLKLIEGSVVSVPLSGNKRHAQQESVMMDTTNIMFICGGAFPDVDKIIKTRVTGGGVGFGMTHNIGENKISRQDLVTFGMIPEFVGRFPSIVEMKALTETELRRILTEPKNSIVKQFQELLAMDGVQLEFTDQALDKIARIAIKSKSGARDLRAILYASLVDIMFDAPDTKPANVVITPDEVLEVA